MVFPAAAAAALYVSRGKLLQCFTLKLPSPAQTNEAERVGGVDSLRLALHPPSHLKFPLWLHAAPAPFCFLCFSSLHHYHREPLKTWSAVIVFLLHPRLTERINLMTTSCFTPAQPSLPRTGLKRTRADLINVVQVPCRIFLNELSVILLIRNSITVKCLVMNRWCVC